MEFDADESRADKAYQQAGETMGILRYDASDRPICDDIRKLSARVMNGAEDPDAQVCVLMPSPVFYSNYRYRANQSVFGIFNSLARVGISTDSRFTSSGESLIDAKLLDRYRLIVLGASTYRRDHPEIADMLLEYVKNGGNVFFAMEKPDRILDPYLRETESTAMRDLTGCDAWVQIPKDELTNISADTGVSESWRILHDEPVHFSKVSLPESSVVMATADGMPLLYKNRVGKGCVYVFTWNLDLFMFKGDVMDHYDEGFDWIWRAISGDISLCRDNANELKTVLQEITSMPKRDWAKLTF